MPFHAVPVLFWDGEMLAQTQAIARFEARIQNSKDLLEKVLPKWLSQAEALLKKR